MGRVRVTVAAVEKAIIIIIIIIIIITYSECMFLALGIQHAKRMHRIILSSVVCTIFAHYLTNSTISVQTALNIKCVFLFSLLVLSETFFHSKKNSGEYYY